MLLCLDFICYMLTCSSRKGRLIPLREKLRRGLAEKVEYTNFTGHPEQRLPGHLSFWIEFVEGESLLLLLARNGVCAASGSSCSSNIKGRMKATWPLPMC